jgi:hypothetical protein
MDSATRRFVGFVREYLDDVQGRAHMPVSQEAVDGLNNIVSQLEEADPLGEEELSPGQRQAMSLSEPLLQDVELNPEDSLTPGERAAQQAAGADAS